MYRLLRARPSFPALQARPPGTSTVCARFALSAARVSRTLPCKPRRFLTLGRRAFAALYMKLPTRPRPSSARPPCPSPAPPRASSLRSRFRVAPLSSPSVPRQTSAPAPRGRQRHSPSSSLRLCIPARLSRSFRDTPASPPDWSSGAYRVHSSTRGGSSNDACPKDARYRRRAGICRPGSTSYLAGITHATRAFASYPCGGAVVTAVKGRGCLLRRAACALPRPRRVRPPRAVGSAAATIMAPRAFNDSEHADHSSDHAQGAVAEWGHTSRSRPVFGTWSCRAVLPPLAGIHPRGLLRSPFPGRRLPLNADCSCVPPGSFRDVLHVSQRPTSRGFWCGR
ncbi:hypothetical protein B0H17DRAFT_350250 [Mycena rosella]|uniref:Uncharacterized protein n=1 Tax=Mycena rosella TaxID=1033263 RepID=A0AAD7CT14_MYCRO|nr:hypothetical protein B0H17DRAFT_350250 [Mycena rosella]